MAEEQVKGVSSVASAMAKLSAQAAASANQQRLRIAQGNIRAGEAQLERQESTQRRAVARAFAQHQGSVLASSAFRGTGGGQSTEQGILAATIDASEQVAIIEGNRAAQEMALIASNQVQLEDPFMAGVQGGIAGLDLGMSLARALSGLAEQETSQRSEFAGFSGGAGIAPSIPVFSNQITTTLETPGLNLGDIFNMDTGEIAFNFGVGDD